MTAKPAANRSATAAVSPDVAALAAHVTPGAVLQAIRRGVLPATREGRRLWITITDLKAWIDGAKDRKAAAARAGGLARVAKAKARAAGDAPEASAAVIPIRPEAKPTRLPSSDAPAADAPPPALGTSIRTHLEDLKDAIDSLPDKVAAAVGRTLREFFR